jgi:S-adenosylmethionine synthetase
MSTYLFTSESVSMGHPDKVSDQISDAVLDELLAEDPASRVACETVCATGMVMLVGELGTNAKNANLTDVVRETVRKIGYVEDNMRFDADSCSVLNALGKQSSDIYQGVATGGAGDQGLMFGFACRETDTYMPLPIHLSHRLVERQALVREQAIIKGLRPDAKSQVTVVYEGDVPVKIDTVVLSTQHSPAWNDKMAELKTQVIEHIIKPVLGAWWHDQITVHVNPTGRFEIGGPHGDAGLTGRKIIVDTYGGRGRHGGGAFSGKDASKVDRSAAYMARYVAKNIVAAGLADRCELQLSYAIGVTEPTSVYLDCQGTEKVDTKKLAEVVRKTFPLTPQGIIEHLKLRSPIFGPTARHGHFGREPYTGTYTNLDKSISLDVEFFTWEKLDKVAELKAAFA